MAVYHVSLQQTFIGCYLLILFLIALFALASTGSAASLVPIILMVTFLAVCIVYHALMNQALEPLVKYSDESDVSGLLQKALEPLGQPFISTAIYYGIKPGSMSLLRRSFSYITRTVESEEMYFHPHITAKVPSIWVPQDMGGASKQEVRDSLSHGIPMSDEGA